MKIARQDLLEQLEVIIPGISKRDMIEQANCFLFLDNRIITFNDEMMIAVKTTLDIKGAVQAEPLISLIRKMTDTTLEISASENNLQIKGKRRRRSSMRLDREVLFDFSKMEFPKKWKKLPDNFGEAISKVYQCAGKDSSLFSLTCVHLHPKWVEAFDNFQVSRFKCQLDIENPILVPSSTIKNVISMEVDRFGVTESWIHFSNENGMVLSCRTDNREYPDTTPVLKAKGNKIVLPKGLKECTERAEIFSSQNQDENVVMVNIQSGKILIKGEGAVGWYKEEIKIPYKGDDIHFLIPPTLLGELSSDSTQCEIDKDKLIVRGKDWIYVTSLGKSR